MKTLIIDGHPDQGRLVSHLLDHYAGALADGNSVEMVAMRDTTYEPNMRTGYKTLQPWEPDLERLAASVLACDHLVIGFPLWWGAEPALVKGWLDRMIMPGFAFRYRRNQSFWDRLLAGRSADVVITMDTPPWYLSLVYGNPVGKRWRRQILGFCGIKPIRMLSFGPTRQGGAAKNLARWERTLTHAAQSAPGLRRAPKVSQPFDALAFSSDMEERQS